MIKPKNEHQHHAKHIFCSIVLRRQEPSNNRSLCRNGKLPGNKINLTAVYAEKGGQKPKVCP